MLSNGFLTYSLVPADVSTVQSWGIEELLGNRRIRQTCNIAEGKVENQSVNKTSIAPISQSKPGSVARNRVSCLFADLHDSTLTKTPVYLNSMLALSLSFR